MAGDGMIEGSRNAARIEWELLQAAAGAAGLDSATLGPAESVFFGAVRLAGEGSGGMEFCVPHRQLEFHVLKRERSRVETLQDLREKEIVVVHGSEVVAFLERLGFGAQLLRVPTVAGAAGLLASGKKEVAILEKFAMRADLEAGDIEGMTVLPEPLYAVNAGFAVGRGKSEMRAALEGGIDAVRRSGEFDRITERHLLQSAAFPPRGLFSAALRFAPWLLIPVPFLLLALWKTALCLRRRAMDKILHLQEQVMDEKVRLAQLRDDAAKQRFVLNQLSTVSLVDQILESSGSREREGEPEAE